MKPIRIGAGIIVLGAFVWGGFGVKHEVTCRGLQKDYVNGAAELRSNAMLKSLGDPKLARTAEMLEEAKLRRMQGILSRLYLECGERAGEAAAREGSETVLGS
jgi:hypothetical protein